jgi:hypothetical protein
MVMALFHEIFLLLLRRIADGQERTSAIRHAPLADDFGLTDGERVGILTSRRTIA